MENKHSSDGIAEDMIRSITQTACAEVHAKTLIEKFDAQLHNGEIDLNDEGAVKKHLSLLTDIDEEMHALTKLRREMMLKLYDMYQGDKNYWCMIKHLAVASYTAFEAYQASDDDAEMLNIALEANNRFIKALSHFLGVEITECASCFAEILKAKRKDEIVEVD